MNIIEKPSPNFDSREGREPSIIILHYTGMKTAEDALDRLTDKASQVSAHYTIDEDGAIYKHVNEDQRAWHAGKSYWQGGTNINAVSVGIEIVNKGHEFGYVEFPKVQIKAVQDLCLEIMSRYQIEHVLGHSDVAPDRRQDPGELFPWHALAKAGIGVWPDHSDNVSDIDVVSSLKSYGYGNFDDNDLITAFQRHYVPEVFEQGTVGQVCDLTKSRLSALISNHLISKA